MAKDKTKNQGKSVRVIVFALVSLGVLIAWMMRDHDNQLLSPKGLIAQQQRNLMLFSAGVMLEFAIPTLFLLYFISWKYRESNAKADYEPHSHHSKSFLLGLWLIPAVIVLVLQAIVWPATHRLDPHKLVVAGVKPLTVQVIALRWKWLFIYPDQGVASLNFVEVPTETPVQFDLTADEAPMNSFWIPHLGGQLYAMTGHDNRLNLMADTPGDYAGRSAEINGDGFADMKFVARASSKVDFDLWVQGLKQSSESLDATAYQRLLTPSKKDPVVLYSLAYPDLYETVLAKYGSHAEHMGY